MGLRAFLFILVFMGKGFAASEVAQTFSYQGRLYNATGTTPSNEQVVFIFSLLAPLGNDCLLYQETQSLDMGLTDGYFSFKLGSFRGDSKRTTDDPDLTMAQVFGSTSTQIRAVASANCASGYTPAAGDERRLRISLARNGGTFSDLSPDQALSSATQALVAQTLQGYLPSQFIKTSSNITQLNVEDLLDGGDATTLHHHDSRYFVPNASTPQNLGAGGAFTSGSVGIGTTNSATSQLNVNGSTNSAGAYSITAANQSGSPIFSVGNNGFVGIGTFNPIAQLQLSTDYPGPAFTQMLVTNSSTYGRTSSVVMSDTYPNNFLANMTHGINYGYDYYLSDSLTEAGVSMLLAQGVYVTKLAMGTYDAAPATIFTSNVQRLYVTAAGNVGIATTTPNEKFEVNGNIRITGFNGGGLSGASIDNNGNITRTPSDVRLKKNIRTIDKGLEKVLALRGVTYDWVDDRSGGQRDMGLIAQELKKVVPEVVSQTKEKDSFMSVNYGHLVGVVVEGIKELYQKLVQTDSRVARLEAENKELKERLDRLEKQLRAPASPTQKKKLPKRP